METIFLQEMYRRFTTIKQQGDEMLTEIAESALTWQPNKDSNSVSILVKHLHGNMLSRATNFLHTDGEKPTRNRNAEFYNDISSKKELLALWQEGWDRLLAMLQNLRPYDVHKYVALRGEQISVIEALTRMLVHYSEHVGQIIYITKLKRS